MTWRLAWLFNAKIPSSALNNFCRTPPAPVVRSLFEDSSQTLLYQNKKQHTVEKAECFISGCRQLKALDPICHALVFNKIDDLLHYLLQNHVVIVFEFCGVSLSIMFFTDWAISTVEFLVCSSAEIKYSKTFQFTLNGARTYLFP